MMMLGSAGVPTLIGDIGFCLVIACLLSVVFARLKVPTIAAFLAGGVLVGPIAGKLVTDRANIDTIAGLGLILLLFVIGLEMDLRKLLKSGKTLILSGLLQFPLCVGFGYGASWLLQAAGWGSLGGGYVPLYVGFVTAASSTLLVVKLFLDAGQLDTVVGRVSLGILIFQDVWSIVVLAVQPNFADPGVAKILLTFLDIAVVGALAWAGARWLLPIAARWIARLPELMLVLALGWCFGVGMLGNHMGHLLGCLGLHLDMSISLEMGALIAGTTLAGKAYSFEVVSKVGVVRDFFITLFFVGLGMGIPVPDSLDVLLVAGALAAVCVLARMLVFFPLMYFTGMERRGAFVGSTRLAQISEFCLVIAYLGLNYGHVEAGFVSSVIFAFVITALASPFLFKGADRLHDLLRPLLRAVGFRDPPGLTESLKSDHHHEVVLLGFHRVASSLFFELQKSRPEVLRHTLVIDFNVALHEKIRATGASVRYGDFSNTESLHHLGIHGAKVVICTIPDDILKGTSNLKLAGILRKSAPHAVLILNALTSADAQRMYAAGADYVLLPRVESAHALLPALEAALGGQIAAFREDHDARLGAAEARAEILG